MKLVQLKYVKKNGLLPRTSSSPSSFFFYTILLKFHSRLSDDDDNRDRKPGEHRRISSVSFQQQFGGRRRGRTRFRKLSLGWCFFGFKSCVFLAICGQICPKKPQVKLKVYQISANLVHRELRNATFEGKKIATSIKRPDSGNYVVWFRFRFRPSSPLSLEPFLRVPLRRSDPSLT